MISCAEEKRQADSSVTQYYMHPIAIRDWRTHWAECIELGVDISNSSELQSDVWWGGGALPPIYDLLRLMPSILTCCD